MNSTPSSAIVPARVSKRGKRKKERERRERGVKCLLYLEAGREG